MFSSGKVTHRAFGTSDLHQDLKLSFGVAFNTFFTLEEEKYRSVRFVIIFRAVFFFQFDNLKLWRPEILPAEKKEKQCNGKKKFYLS